MHVPPNIFSMHVSIYAAFSASYFIIDVLLSIDRSVMILLWIDKSVT
jgi:hypothetical protein